MAYCRTAVTPLLMHWNNGKLELSHWYEFNQLTGIVDIMAVADYCWSESLLIGKKKEKYVYKMFKCISWQVLLRIFKIIE